MKFFVSPQQAVFLNHFPVYLNALNIVDSWLAWVRNTVFALKSKYTVYALNEADRLKENTMSALVGVPANTVDTWNLLIAAQNRARGFVLR